MRVAVTPDDGPNILARLVAYVDLWDQPYEQLAALAWHEAMNADRQLVERV